MCSPVPKIAVTECFSLGGSQSHLLSLFGFGTSREHVWGIGVTGAGGDMVSAQDITHQPALPLALCGKGNVPLMWKSFSPGCSCWGCRASRSGLPGSAFGVHLCCQAL